MTNVRQTSVEALHNIGKNGETEIIMRILSLFKGDPEIRLTRQEIEDITQELPGRRIPINTVCGRVNHMLLTRSLVEDGWKYGNHSGAKQYLLRLFNPEIDKDDSQADLNLRLRHAQGTLILLRENCEYVTVYAGSDKKKFKRQLSFADGEIYQLAKVPAMAVIEMEILDLVRDLRAAMGLMFTPGED